MCLITSFICCNNLSTQKQLLRNALKWMRVLKASYTCILISKNQEQWLTLSGQPIKVNRMHWISNKSKMSKSWNISQKTEIIYIESNCIEVSSFAIRKWLLTPCYNLKFPHYSLTKTWNCYHYSSEDSPSLTFPYWISKRIHIRTIISNNV